MKLNINRVWGEISSRELSNTEVAKILNVSEATIRYREKKDNWLADEIAILADTFGKEITWFFDYSQTAEAKIDAVAEESVFYGCKSCRDKEKIISLLEENLTNMKEKVTDLQERLGEVNDREMGKTG